MVVFSLWRWSSFLPPRFLVPRRTPDTPALRTVSLTGLLPSPVRRSCRLQLPCSVTLRGPYPARIATCGLGSSGFARHYSRNRYYFLFLPVLRCFSSRGSPHLLIYSVNDTATLLAVRSRIRISADLCSFAAPRGFSQLVTSFFGAMYHRHPPYALRSLIFSSFLVYSSLHIQILRFQLGQSVSSSKVSFRLPLLSHTLLSLLTD